MEGLYYSKRTLELRWLLLNFGVNTVLHFHRLRRFYHTGNALTSFAKAFLFILKILIARLIGYKVFWTIHNVIPLDSETTFLDLIIARFLRAVSDIIFIPNESFEDWLKAYKKKVRLVPTPRFQDALFQGELLEKKIARFQLNIPLDRNVILFLGHVRKYKEIETLLSSMRIIGNKFKLYVVGRHWYEMAKTKVDNIVFVNKHFNGEEARVWLSACDVLVATYNMRNFKYGIHAATPQLGMSSGVKTVTPFHIKGAKPKSMFIYESGNAVDLAMSIEKALGSNVLPEYCETITWRKYAMENHCEYIKAF